MIWVTWRQYRVELLLIGAMLVALTGYLVPTGLHGHDVFSSSGLRSCLEAEPLGCWDLKEPVQTAYDSSRRFAAWFVLFPGVLGIVMAAPVVFEFDRGTYRLSWTQSISRNRWLWSKVSIALAMLSALALAFTFLMSWWYSPLDRLDPVSGHVLESYPLKGILPVAYAVLAFSATLGIGALTRRSIVAVVMGIVVFVAVLAVIETLLRGANLTVTIYESTGAVDDRFWEFQSIETAIVLITSIVFMSITAWVIQTRMR